MSIAIIRNPLVVVSLAAACAGAIGCSAKVREGQSPAYLIVNNVLGASGTDKTFSNTLASDVLTKGTIFEDTGQATMTLALKDIGAANSPTAPTTNNFITLTRYHVSYRRADGRNAPGVDVPFPFDGAATATITDSVTTFTFILVRVQAKQEMPLITLAGNGGAQVINTIADVTFYGQDQTGNEVRATGSISVNFADWADPQ
jgi:hypothetical protein